MPDEADVCCEREQAAREEIVDDADSLDRI
jgi:hypothetical protein